MDIISLVAGAVAGFLLGVGATLFYLKWKMQAQLSSMEEQMGALMDATGDMSSMMDDMDIEESREDSEEK